MIGYTGIETIEINQTQLEYAFKFLRYAGTKGVEGVALFAGITLDTVFHVKETIIPEQKSYILEQGLMYAVDSNEMHRLNLELYKNEMQLIAQIHSHPGLAYHSEADNRYPIVDTYGGISIVVPNFATGEVSLKEAAVFRLALDKTWNKLSDKEVDSLFKVR